MPDLKKIVEVTMDYTLDQLVKNTELIKKEYKEKQIEIVTDFVKIMSNLFEESYRLQEEGKKGNVSFIYFSFLYSNVLMNKRAFRIDVFNEEMFLDDIEVTSEWSFDFVFKYIDSDMEKIKRIISSNYIKIKNYELWELKNSYEYNYYLAVEFILKELTDCINKLKCFKKMKKNEKVYVMFGEYMEKPIVLQVFEEKER